MRAINLTVLAGAVVLALLFVPKPGTGQPPPQAVEFIRVQKAPAIVLDGQLLIEKIHAVEAERALLTQAKLVESVKLSKDAAVKPPSDDDRAILNEIKEAYKAPHEVDDDIRQELRRAVKQPTPERESKILYEARRLYRTTPDQEQAILREVRRAVQQPTPDQEAKVFQEIRRLGQLPLGTVPLQTQTEQAQRLFRKLDGNGDGRLVSDEMPASLSGERSRWDANRDGGIDANEFMAYYQSRHQTLAAQVASGDIPMKNVPASAQAQIQPPTESASAEERPPVVYRAGKLPAGLPDWFARLDADADGQLGLYEWRESGRPFAEFARMDRNDDGFLTADEMLFFQAHTARERPAGNGDGTPTTIVPSGYGSQPDKRAIKLAAKESSELPYDKKVLKELIDAKVKKDKPK